jgi:hypothetical protein
MAAAKMSGLLHFMMQHIVFQENSPIRECFNRNTIAGSWEEVKRQKFSDFAAHLGDY